MDIPDWLDSDEVPAWRRLPESLKPAIDLYVDHGVEPGSFTRAVIENNFTTAIFSADSGNILKLQDIARFVFNVMPTESWGSLEKRLTWQRRGGLKGGAGL